MKFEARATGRFVWNDRTVRCALGKGGVVDAAHKREGDGASPLGDWPIRRVFFRPDRLQAPKTGLNLQEILADDGWCDAPGDENYNRLVKLPYPASAEKMWREDSVYDVVVELGYNDDPAVDGLGSAIFLHVKRGDYEPTEGCVALSLDDLLNVLADAGPGSSLRITR